MDLSTHCHFENYIFQQFPIRHLFHLPKHYSPRVLYACIRYLGTLLTSRSRCHCHHHYWYLLFTYTYFTVSLSVSLSSSLFIVHFQMDEFGFGSLHFSLQFSSSVVVQVLHWERCTRLFTYATLYACMRRIMKHKVMSRLNDREREMIWTYHNCKVFEFRKIWKMFYNTFHVLNAERNKRQQDRLLALQKLKLLLKI